MMIADHKPSQCIDSVTDRLLMSFPSGQYCLPGLLRILEIVETEDVPTACVQCSARPKLFINPQFVRRHAETSEKLLMLVLHELHHVILGHTRLYPRVTKLDNLVFDAVINAMLCHLFPDPAYTSLFTGIYKEDRFPECFLRPADGWGPGRRARIPVALRGPDRKNLADLHVSLYGKTGETYSTLRSALESEATITGFEVGRLIGDHREEGMGSSSDGKIEHHSPALFEELRRIVERWPRPPQPIEGRSLHELLEGSTVKIPPPSSRTSFERLLRRIGDNRHGTVTRRYESRDTYVASAIPRSDRRALVIGALGGRPVLYNHESQVRGLVPAGEKVHVYLDVSGSIGDLTGPLYAAVLNCQRFVHATVHLFSTKVADVTLDELRKGICRSTYGTSIGCVAEHIRKNHIRRAVVITDGYVGRPGTIDAETLSGARLGVALTPGGSNRSDLEGVVDEWIELKEIA